MADHQVDFGEFLGTIPYLVGYELRDDHVAMIALNGEGIVGPVGALDAGNDGGQLDLAIHSAVTGLHQTVKNTEYNDVMFVGYGPNGDALADRFASAHSRVPGVARDTTLVHIHNGQWRDRTRELRVWSEPEPIPDVAAIAALQGLRPPASSRDEYGDRYHPTTEPTFEPLPQQQREALSLNKMSPSLQAEVATQMLDRLSEPGVQPNPEHMATVSHILNNTPLPSRDLIILNAAETTARTDALVNTYRGAPPQERPAVAAAAAAATYFGNGTGADVETILKEAESSQANEGLIDLVKHGNQRGITVDPQSREGFKEAVVESLERVDQKWEVQRIMSASFPSPPQAVAPDQSTESKPSPHASPQRDTGLER